MLLERTSVEEGPPTKKSREQFHFTHCKKKLYMPLTNNRLFLSLFIVKNAYFYGVEIEISICYGQLLWPQKYSRQH